MTRQKDLKRLVRARMTKTGESYTAARAVVVARPRDVPPAAAPRKDWPRLAGMSDLKLREQTGRTWEEWVAVLDAARAWEMSHRDIARHLVTTHGVPSWWNQMVTVGYERIRGLREVGQRRGGTFEASKSRTIAAPIATVFAMFQDARRRKRWLPDGPTRLRTAVPDKSLRFDWADGTQVHVHLTAKGPEKTAVSVQHGKLPARGDVERTKAFWAERLQHLSAALA